MIPKSARKAAQRERKKAREAAAAGGAPAPGAAPPTAAAEAAGEGTERAAKRAQIVRDVAEARANAAWRRFARRRSLLAAARLRAWGRMVRRMVRPWWVGAEVRINWRCLMLHLFSPWSPTVIRTDPQSCLDEMLEYREKYAGFAPGNAMDMEAYYDNYDPDRAYHDAVAKPEEWYTSALAAFGIGSDD
jgi:hypothetical protein